MSRPLNDDDEDGDCGEDGETMENERKITNGDNKDDDDDDGEHKHHYHHRRSAGDDDDVGSHYKNNNNSNNNNNNNNNYTNDEDDDDGNKDDNDDDDGKNDDNDDENVEKCHEKSIGDVVNDDDDDYHHAKKGCTDNDDDDDDDDDGNYKVKKVCATDDDNDDPRVILNMEASNQSRNNGDNISDDDDNDDKDNNNCDNGGDNEFENDDDKDDIKNNDEDEKDDDKDGIKNDDEDEREIGTAVGLTGVHVHFETEEDHHQDQHRDHHQDHRRNDDDHYDHRQHENLNKENNNDDDNNSNDNNTVDDPYEQLQLLRHKRRQRSEDGDVFYDKSPGIIEKDTSNNNQQHEEQQQLQLSGRVSEKLEQLQEKFNASSSHKEANVVTTAGKLKDGQIEVFEKFQHGVGEQGEQTSSSSKVKDVVLKGRANEIKEMLEKGSLNSSAANVTTATSASKTNHDVTDDVVPPPQQVRKKKADEWLTAVKHTPATSGAPTATRQTTTPLKDNFWLRRDTQQQQQQQQQPSNDKSPTIARVGRLNFEEKMALFGGGAKSGDGAASHKATPTNDHSYLNKTTTANSAPSYKTFKRDNSNTPNVVSYTSNSVKTDMKVSLVARNSNDAKNNMYLHLDRNGLVKLIEELKSKVSTLEQEASNLKLQLENRGSGRSGYMDDCRPATNTGNTLDNDQATDN